LPGLEGSELPAKPPAHRQIYVSCRVSDVREVMSDVVECVAEAGPQEPCLGMIARAQAPQPLRRVPDLQNFADGSVGLGRRLHILAAHRIEHPQLLALLLIDPALALGAESPGLE